MKSLLLTTFLVSFGIMCFSQTKIVKYNNKRFSKKNYFYTYNDRKGPSEQSQLMIVQPSKAFWGTLKEDGSIVIIKKDKNDTVIFKQIAVKNHDDHPADKQSLYKEEIYFPEVFYSKIDISNEPEVTDKIRRSLKRIKYTDYKFILQAISVPLKFRKAIDTITYTTETGVNIAFGTGIKYSINWYSANKTFLGQKTNTMSFTPGVLFGLGGVDIKSKVSAPASFKDRKEPIFTFGGFFMFGFNNINIGLVIGKDVGLKNGGKANGWYYNHKTWTGVAIGIDILK